MLMKDIKEKASRYGLFLAIAGVVPLRSGFLLLQEKDCGCFLIDKATLHAHNLLFGWISIVVGAALLLGGLKLYRKRLRWPWVLAFLLAGAAAGYTAGSAPGQEITPIETGNYDVLAQNLTSQGWVVFYANWCPRCHEQMGMFGGSVVYLRMIDCATFKCPSFVKGYPTWARMKNKEVEVREGVQTIQDLEKMAKG
jgi:hypothetical protein